MDSYIILLGIGRFKTLFKGKNRSDMRLHLHQTHHQVANFSQVFQYLRKNFEEEYEKFIDELIKAEKVPAKEFEEYTYFEACLPIDTMAEKRERDPPFFLYETHRPCSRNGTWPLCCGPASQGKFIRQRF